MLVKTKNTPVIDLLKKYKTFKKQVGKINKENYVFELGDYVEINDCYFAVVTDKNEVGGSFPLEVTFLDTDDCVRYFTYEGYGDGYTKKPLLKKVKGEKLKNLIEQCQNSSLTSGVLKKVQLLIKSKITDNQILTCSLTTP